MRFIRRSIFAPDDVGIAGRLKTERRIIGHGVRGGEQYQGHFVADDCLRALDKFLANTQALILLVDGQIRQIAAIRIVRQRPGQSHQLIIHPSRQQEARRGEHARDSREIVGGAFDSGLIEDTDNVQRIKGKIVAIFYGGVFHGFKGGK